MKPYKSLSKYEKLAFIQNEGGFHGKSERHEYAKYLQAIRKNDLAYIEKIEKYGETPHKMMCNKRLLERGLLFGFTDFKFDDSGWAVEPELLEYQEIEFKTQGEKISSNSIDIGRGLNGKWTFGVSYCTGASGGCVSASIWSEIVEPKEEAILKGLNKLIETHNHQREMLYQKDTCGNYNEKYSRSIVSIVKYMIEEIQGIKPVQYELF